MFSRRSCSIDLRIRDVKAPLHQRAIFNVKAGFITFTTMKGVRTFPMFHWVGHDKKGKMARAGTKSEQEKVGLSCEKFLWILEPRCAARMAPQRERGRGHRLAQ